MSSLGTISVQFTANTAKFSNAIRGMTQRLNTFGKAAKNAHASMKPFMAGMGSVSQSVSTTGARMARSAQSMGMASQSLAGVGQTAQSTSTNIYALGNGLHNVLTNFQDVGGSAAQVGKQTNTMTQTFQGAGETADMFASRVKHGNAALQKTIPTGYKVQSSFKLMADGSLQASRRIAKDMTYNKAQMGLFSDFMGKISHYIQFTIGVQLVMKIVQGFQSVIETMKEFEKQAVRTAGVAGRLGGSFDSTVENIKAVSAQLGRETIFSATEAAEAMYDLASAGFNVAEAMEDVENGVNRVGPIIYYAAAQQIELSEATSSVSRALKMFNMDLDDTEMVVDTFTAAIANSFLTAEKLRDALRYSGAMAHTLGISLEETVAANMALADAGLKGCYDKETKVFTNEGFKYFRDLNRNEEFLTYNLDTGEMEWQKATDYIEYEVDRDLYRVKNRYVDLFVTENHNMVVKPRSSNKFIIMRADEVYGKNVEYKLSGSWHNNKSNFKLPSIKSKFSTYERIDDELEIDGLLWTKFMALYLAEGHFKKNINNGNYSIFISQKKNGKAYQVIKDTLDDLPFNYNYGKNGQFRINNKQLHSYLKQFGRSHEKHVPKWIKDNAKEYLEEFYRVYNLCDGDTQGNIYTSSKQMVNDIIELLLKLGYGASYKVKTKKGCKTWNVDHWAHCNHDNYIINVNKKHTTPQFSRKNYTVWHKDRYKDGWGNSIKEEWKHYKGKVYCVTVPNHTLVVERNGKVQISGNSQAGQRLNMILTKLLKPTEKAKKTLANMGLTMEDISPQTHTLTEMLQTLQSAGFGAGEAANFFRARTAGAAAVLIKNAENMEAYRMTLLGAEGMTRQLAERQRDTLWGSFKLVSAAAESTAIKLGELLRPSLEWLAGFIRSTVLPAVDATVAGLQWMEQSFGPLVPMIKGLVISFSMLAVSLFAYKAITIIAAKVTALFAGEVTVLKSTVFPLVSVLGILIGVVLWLNDTFGIFDTILSALSPVLDAIVGGFKDLINWMSPLLELGKAFILTFTPIIPLLKLFGGLQKDAQKAELDKYLSNISEETKEYSDALDNLNKKLDEQRAAEEKVAEATADETASAKELSDAKAELEYVTERAEQAEKEFLATSSQLIQAFASLSENLDTFTGALGKVDEIEDRIERKQSSLESTTEALADMQNEYNEAVSVYGSRSQEAMDIMDEMVKTRKEEIDLTHEIADITNNELSDALEKQGEEYNNLSYAEKLMADQELRLLDAEEKYKKALIDSQSLQAKQNVLLSTRNNFEKFYEDRVQELRDAEQKLYDIELKLYQLRKNQVNNMRTLFDAFADSGMLSKEMIKNYSDMEKAQGALIREQVSYSKTLDTMTKDNRQTVSNWTESYINAMNEGMSKSEAFTHATSQTGQSISDLVGKGTQAYSSILEYAQASHNATSTTNQFRDESMGLASDLVETGQATSEVASAYYSIKSSANEVEDAEKQLKDEMVNSKDATEGVISSVGRLFQYYSEVEGLEGDRTKILQEMISTMGLQEELGTSNASILQRLNKFYGTTNESLDDFTQSQSIAALTAMRLGESMEGISAETIRADDIVEELPVDSFEQWSNIASKVIQEQEDEFDTLKGDIQSNNDEIDKYVERLSQLSEFEGIEITGEEDEGPDWLKGFTDALGGVKDALYNAFVGLGIGIWDIIDIASSTIASGAQAIWDGLVAVGGSIWDFISTSAKSIWDFISGGAKSIWGWITGGVKSIWDWLETSSKKVSDLFTGASTFINDLVTDLINGLTGIISIENLFSGLEGFTNAISSGWDAVSNWFGFSGGAIVKAASGITRTSGPTAAIIGEAGAEAVVPLEGANRINGLSILQDIIPKHFPELTSTPMQTGAIVQGGATTSNTSVVHQYDIHGDINVYSPANGDDAVDEILRRLEDKRRLANY